MKRKRAALMLLGALLLAGCRPQGAQSGSAQSTGAQSAQAGGNDLDAVPSKVAATGVQTTVAREGALRVRRTVSATVTAERDSNVAAQTGGTVARVLAREGQTVQAGQVVVQLDDSALRQSVESARVSLQNAQINLAQGRQNTTASTPQLREAVRAARANLDKARATVATNRDLFAIGGLSQSDLTASEAQLAQAQSDYAGAQNTLAQNGRSGGGSLALLQNQLESAQIALRQARENLVKTGVRAPFGGIVASLAAEQGEYVNVGATVFRLVDPGTLKANFGVPPADAGALTAGSLVNVSYAGHSYGARVTSGNPVAGSDRLVPISAKLSNANLPVGAVVQLSYGVTLGQGVLLPITALQGEAGGGNAVYLAENGAAKRVGVTVVAESRGTVAVRGVQAGARVVNPVPPSLQDGAAIAVSNPGSNGGSNTDANTTDANTTDTGTTNSGTTDTTGGTP